MNKDRVMLPPSNNNVLCSYPSPAMYSAGDGVAVWPVDASQSYHAGMRSIPQDEDPRRWLHEQGQGFYSRDRRSECRSLPAPLHPIHASHSSHPNGFSSSFMTTNVPEHPSFQAPYGRGVQDVPSPLSPWENWDVHVDSNSSMSHVRRFDEKSSSWNSPAATQVVSLEPQTFDNLMFASSDSASSPGLYTPPPEQAIQLNGFSFPQHISPIPSPTPSPVDEDIKPIIHPVASSTPYPRRRASDDRSDTGKSCSHCHATSTPLWRRDPSTMKPLCNACGLYLQQRNKLRPQELIDADDDGSTSEESDANYVGPECSHCRTHRTSVWRRSKNGDQLCNACGVYARLRGKPRPLSLKKNKIRPRSKHSPK